MAVVVWIAVMYLHVWRRHDRYGTFDNDLGFHDQYVWLLARGETFSTVLGLHVLGHNATWGYVLLAPLSWVGLGPQGLNLICTIAIGLLGLAVFDLARARGVGDRMALGLCLMVLLHPVTQGNAWETFHPEVMAVVPLVMAYRWAGEQRWWKVAGWVAFALVWKSDVGLFVAMLGVLVALRGQRGPGLRLMLAGLGWTAVTTMVVIPHYSGGGTVFGPLFGDLGNSPSDVARTALSDPGKVAGRLLDHQPARYGRDLLAPTGFLALAAPGTLVLAAPQMVINLLSDADFTREWRDNSHYQALPLAAMAIASVEGAARLTRRRRLWGERAVAVGVAAAMAGTVAWGSLWPFTTQFDHYWPNDRDPARSAKDAAVALVGRNDSVLAHYLLVPHLTHRREVYSFPNPYRQVFYGVDGTERPDPATVEWVLMDLNLLATDGPDRNLWDCIVGSGAFETVLSRDGIVVLRRGDGLTQDRACVEG